MRAQGILYPSTPLGLADHMEAVLDFISHSTHPSPLRDKVVIALHEHTPVRRQGAWSRLLGEVRSHNGPVVISNEVLCYLPAPMAEEFIHRLDADDVEVVMVHRRPSQLLPSMYLQALKLAPQPTFSDFVAEFFDQLPQPGVSPYEFIDLRTVISAWEAAGARVVVVEALSGLTDHTMVSACEALAPGVPWQPLDEPSNVSMSAIGAQIWRLHCQDSPPNLVAAAHAVRQRMLDTYPETATGAKPRLTSEAASALDSYCAGHSARLERPDTLVEPLPHPDLDLTDTLAELARWQKAQNRKWRAIDSLSGTLGRGRLMPWPHEV